MNSLHISVPITRLVGIHCNSIKCHKCSYYGQKECKLMIRRHINKAGLFMTSLHLEGTDDEPTDADPLLDRMAEALKDTMCFATNDHDVNILPDHQLVTNEELLAEFDARRGK